MKFCIISGLMEQVQVQLTVVNYLELWKEEETVEWTHILDNEVKTEKLWLFDIVFFIRSKTIHDLSILNHCKNNGIKTVYILDDNWFCDERRKDSQYFKQCMMCSDFIFTYNQVVYDCASIYHPRVYLFEPNVNLLDFKHEAVTRSTYRIGFAGSQSKLLYFAPAFKALLRLMKEKEDLELCFKGVYLPVGFEVYGDRLREEGYTISYKEYAKEVSKWGCDLMISPLEESPYTKGKCPNKYLEITAMGSIGVYSNTSVYRKYVKHLENGFITDNTEEGWYESIKYLMDNQQICKKIKEEAQEDIRKNYTPQVLLNNFKKIIKEILYK